MAFDPSIDDAEILKHLLPEHDTCKLPLTMQHPLSNIEIIAFDSSYTLLFSRDFSLLERVKKSYPKAENLETVLKTDRVD